MSVRRLANLANISTRMLSLIGTGLRKPSADILQQMRQGTEDQRRDPVRTSPASSTRAHAAARGSTMPFLGDPLLTNEQRQALLNVYELRGCHISVCNGEPR